MGRVEDIILTQEEMDKINKILDRIEARLDNIDVVLRDINKELNIKD
jgi:tetrahydromethanopterin S-methyltransferase subunit G